ncbi:MAG: nucleotidyltransferase family protein [Lachnospiraceae bacterium]|nr:nucleotidyltransferase family protein [Lachnospiraceae bacterium]
MGHIGIIAEYNPFHNGHDYQLTTVRRLFPDKHIITIMSGDFVQRGEPSVYNKYLRTKCALLSGVDLVFELPPLFATASAEHFASAAVLALAATGVVDTLCFGAEDDCIDDFDTIANLLVSEPEGYRKLLKEHLKSGLSYPKARSLSISTYLKKPHYKDLLKRPNNILGIEYLKAVKRFHLSFTPIIIKRTGTGYHDLSLESSLSSATAIRSDILKNGLTASLENLLPKAVYGLLTEKPFARPLFPKHFYPLLQYALWEHKTNLTGVLDINESLANQLAALSSYPADYDSLINQLTAKNVTASRIRHGLLNILLGYTYKDMENAKQNNYITYLRLLGFNRSSGGILKQMKQLSAIPIINKVADASSLLSKEQFAAFEKDISVSDLYRHVFTATYHQIMKTEYEHTVIIHEDVHTF